MQEEDWLRSELEKLQLENQLLRQQLTNMEQAGLGQLIQPWQEQPGGDLEIQIALLKSLLDLLPDTVYIKNLRSQKLYANQADARMCGVEKPADLIGKTDFDVYPADVASYLFDEEQRIFSSGEPMISAEEPIVLANGEKVWLLTTKVPLRSADGRIIGLIGLGRNVTDRKIAEIALAQAHAALHLWVAELEQRQKQAHLLNELSQALLGCEREDQVYNALAHFMELIFQRYPGGLCRFDNALENTHLALRVLATWGEAKVLPHGVLGHECSFMRNGTCRLSKDVLVDENQAAKGALAGTGALAAWGGELLAPDVCLPLEYQGRVQGGLFQHFPSQVGQTPAAGRYLDPGLKVENWQELAQSVVERLSLTLTNLRLSESLRNQSIRDPLTGLFNRRYMEETLEREVHRALRSRQGLWLLMIDLDNFKPVNDTLGHAAGDALLRRLGQYFNQHVRADDTSCRYGGDEFVILLSGLSLEDAFSRAESLRLGALEILADSGLEQGKPVSMSIGLACVPLHASSSAALLHAADRALYRAKQKGRNQSVVFS